ncbi:MAG: type II toxin-antitoxin system RelE/ParE family toxin [Anaerolineaceae bacterium]|nr:type II toxin-antitoxin system RelE/ParE family toxin [Anaerolineaceae bacterium]
MFSVFITKPAEDDLQSAISYIADELKNPVAAQRLLDKAEKTIVTLTSMPLRHELVSDEYLRQIGIRVIPIDNYLAFYFVNAEEEKVVVIRILYARRDWQNILNYKI